MADAPRKSLLAAAKDKIKQAAKNIAAQLDFFARFQAPEIEAPIDFPIDVGRDTIWATEQQMAALFGVDQKEVKAELRRLFDTGELNDDQSTHAVFDSKDKNGRIIPQVDHYSLDVIFPIGYRINGKRARTFMRWANSVLKGYIEEGYALNGARLSRDPKALQSLVDEVRAIRASEKLMYDKVRETLALCAADYDPSSETVRQFFADVQNRFHFAVTENTAAQIILSRADGTKPNMGMIAIGNQAPTLALAKVAKNYMTTEELRQMELLGEQWLLFAESMALRRKQVSMERLIRKLDEILDVLEYRVFPGYKGLPGSRDAANEHARIQLGIYKETQKRALR